MAPTKFGLFKTRSGDSQSQPITENLSLTSISSERVTTPPSPIASTSKGITYDSAASELSTLRLYSDDDISPITTPSRSTSICSRLADSESDYQLLKSLPLDASSTTYKNQEFDDASTTYDANSLQFDENSIASGRKFSTYSGTQKKAKKIKSKTARQLRDINMWRASNVEVMQNLLRKSGTVDEQIKWEAIAKSRGLCTLTDNCTCGDCTNCKFIGDMADGDGGLGAAPFLSAVNVGCRLQ